MTKEKKIDSNETKNFMESLKANESLKNVLSTALKNTQSLMSVLLPKISLAICEKLPLRAALSALCV